MLRPNEFDVAKHSSENLSEENASEENLSEKNSSEDSNEETPIEIRNAAIIRRKIRLSELFYRMIWTVIYKRSLELKTKGYSIRSSEW